MEVKDVLTRMSEFLILGEGFRTSEFLDWVGGVEASEILVTVFEGGASGTLVSDWIAAASVLRTPNGSCGLCKACTHSGGEGAR